MAKTKQETKLPDTVRSSGSPVDVSNSPGSSAGDLINPVTELAKELFVRNYQIKGNIQADHIARLSLEAAQTFFNVAEEVSNPVTYSELA